MARNPNYRARLARDLRIAVDNHPALATELMSARALLLSTDWRDPIALVERFADNAEQRGETLLMHIYSSMARERKIQRTQGK